MNGRRENSSIFEGLPWHFDCLGYQAMAIVSRASVAIVVAVTLSLHIGARADVAATLPNAPDSVKFAVIGDGGTGDQPQFDVARQMANARARFGFDLVIMVGDNFFGRQSAADLRNHFELPYKPLLDAGVAFHAALGNHDDPRTIDYSPLNMGGRRYHTFARGHVRFVALDSNEIDRPQLEWLERTLRDAPEPWKVSYFHHPLYSNGGRHGSSVDLRILLEPLLIKYGVNVVFSGHDHSYERLTPQNGIQYFVCGAGGKLRKGDLKRSATTAAGFDADQSFMLAEIGRTEMFFEAISRTGKTVDSGSFRRRAISGTN